jgi:hypothetical protein
MTTQPHLYSHHYKHHRAPVVAAADGPHDVDAGYLAADDDQPPLPPPVLHPMVVPPSLTSWWLPDFEDSPATYRFLTDCTTLNCHRAVKAIMAKTLYGTVAILPTAVAQITREDMLQYLTMAQLVFTVGSTSLASCLPRPQIVELDEQDYMVPLRLQLPGIRSIAMECW